MPVEGTVGCDGSKASASMTLPDAWSKSSGTSGDAPPFRKYDTV
jgi:hypothetical protein